MGRLIPLVLAGVVAVVAANWGIRAALVSGLAFGLALALAVVLLEHDRWRAQDVFQWYQRSRLDRWRRDTGGDSTGGDPAAAEIWLGAHQRGTVPQLYRALAAYHTGDPVVIQREVAAMPAETPLDLAWKEWLAETTRFSQTGTADPAELVRVVADLPPSADRQAFESWIATVESARRRLDRDRRWIAPLARARATAERTPLGFRRRARIWLSRFAVLIMFAVPAVVLSSIALAIAVQGEPIPPEYSQTTYAIRGDLPGLDEQASLRVLPALARSLADAERLVPEALDNATYDDPVDRSVPTLIWTTDKIELEPPADLHGHRIWSTEVLLGALGRESSSAILIVDAEDGPAYLYRIDASVFGRIRKAVGLPIASPPP